MSLTAYAVERMLGAMFEVIPEPEFSAWFEALPEPLAEEVTAAIDLAASAGGVLEPERLSRLLLWYDGTGTGSGLESLGLGLGPGGGLPVTEAHRYLMWHQEVVLCLDSALFQERLGQLAPELAAQALGQVERLKRRLHAARLTGNYSAWRAGPTGQPPQGDAVRAVFLDLLALMGLEPKLVLGSGSGLRELSISNVKPGLRVLFGLDFPARRLIAILGETLNRHYYGDSVERAQEFWRKYRAQQHASVTEQTR